MTDPNVNEMVLDDVQLTDHVAESMDAVQESQSFAPPLQPGVYKFQLPDVIPGMNGNLLQAPWKLVPARPATGDKPATDARVQIAFADDFALKVLESPDHGRDGEQIRQSISNVPRDQTRGGVTVKVNDLLFLLKKVGYTGPVPKTNREYVEALSKQGGKTVKCETGMSWNCNEHRDVYMLQWKDANDEAKGTTRVEVKGQKGCGTKHNPFAKDASRKVAMVDGAYPAEIQCSKCGALVRGFSNLDLARAV